MKIGLLAADYGDGSSGIDFFRSIDKATDACENSETYWHNDEVTEIEVPDDFVPPGSWADDTV